MKLVLQGWKKAHQLQHNNTSMLELLSTPATYTHIVPLNGLRGIWHKLNLQIEQTLKRHSEGREGERRG